jgi:hypothetical protein
LQPVTGLQKNIQQGPFIVFWRAENLDQHHHWHPDSWFVEDTVFQEFEKAFSLPGRSFYFYGPNEYTVNDMVLLSDRLSAHMEVLKE